MYLNVGEKNSRRMSVKGSTEEGENIEDKDLGEMGFEGTINSKKLRSEWESAQDFAEILHSALSTR